MKTSVSLASAGEDFGRRKRLLHSLSPSVCHSRVNLEIAELRRKERKRERGRLIFGVGDHDITEFDITESDVTFFQEFDITESDITEKGNFYNGIRYNGICYNMKLEIGITKFVTVESDITGKWKLI